MWLIAGPFEPAQSEDVTKLLKTNCVYGVGRHRDTALSINNKKVSRKNGEFIVGELPVDEVSNPAFVPTLSLRNNKSAAMKVSRGDDTFIVNPESTYELESGDVVRLASNVNATITWDPKICFHPSDSDVPPFDATVCASIGLKVVDQHTRDVTHHITANLTAPFHSSILLSLLNPAWFVNGEWVLELIRRAQVADEHEKTYVPPPESEYLPQTDHEFAEHYPTLTSDVSWKPNKDRKGLFSDTRFIFVVIGSGIGSTTKAMSDLVSRGGADRQLINVEREAEQQSKGGGGTWATVLKKKKTVLKEGMRSGLVLVCDHEAMTARGVPRNIKKAWEVMVDNAKSVNMRVIAPSLITEAILNANISLLDCVIDEGVVDSSSDVRPLPESIPSSLPEEPSQLASTSGRRPPPKPNDADEQGISQRSQDSVPGPSRRLTRRAASQTPAPEPAQPQEAVEVEEPPESVPKKPLKRRARTGKMVNELLGLDDTAVMDSQVSQGESTPQPDPVLPTPARASRLKRRVGTAAASSQALLEDQATRADNENQILKKFKTLFEESGQGRITSQIDGEAGPWDGDIPGAGTQLPVVREEEEEEDSQDPARTRTQTRKRKADTIADVEMTDAVGGTTAKRRGVEGVNAVERSQKPNPPAVTGPVSPTTTFNTAAKLSKKGAMPGQPDTDPSFLRAIASNKRGKRAEDDFDREFNQLRIAKPVISNGGGNASEAVQLGREWEGLDDFERDVGIRGNFMQIMEFQVWKDVRDSFPGKNTRRESGLGARLDWDGREDFKKFRRKTARGPKEVVKLVLNDRQDGEPEAPAYFDYGGNKKGRGFDESQSQSQSPSYPVFTQTPSSPKRQAKAQAKSWSKPKGILEELGEEDAVEDEIGRSGTNPRGKSQARGRGKARTGTKKKQPLFDLDSEEEAPPEPNQFGEETLDDEEADLTLRSKDISQLQAEKPKTRGTKRKIVLEEDSDSDQGLTFGGFSKKAKKR